MFEDHPLIMALQEEYDRIAQKILEGGCNSHEQYRYLIGQIKGLGMAKDLILALLKKQYEE